MVFQRNFWLVCLLGIAVVCPAGAGMIGLWDFGDAGNLGVATIGNDLTLNNGNASILPTAGVMPGDGAVAIGAGDSFTLNHGIGPNGGSVSYVNEYSLVFDVFAPGPGSWRSLYQTTTTPGGNDGDYWIAPAGQLGVGAIGYTPAGSVSFDQWYRIVIAADLGDATYGGGSLMVSITDAFGANTSFNHGFQALDGRHSLYSTANANVIHFFADNNGEDGPLNISMLAMYDESFSLAAAVALGAPGSAIPEPSTWAIFAAIAFSFWFFHVRSTVRDAG